MYIYFRFHPQYINVVQRFPESGVDLVVVLTCSKCALSLRPHTSASLNPFETK